jgi:hypothetical protein
VGQFFGKYRGTVVNNTDPQNMGRLSVTVPDVSNIQASTWAMPSAALAGNQSGFFAVPPVGSNVWVEFEQGTAITRSGQGVSGDPALKFLPRETPRRRGCKAS